MYKSIILPLAKEDIREAAFWYNEKQKGLILIVIINKVSCVVFLINPVDKMSECHKILSFFNFSTLAQNMPVPKCILENYILSNKKIIYYGKIKY